MPKNYSTSELRDILELTNKKFSNLIKKNTEVSKSYSEITQAYQNLINLIDQNKPTNIIRQFYRLEAELGLIQGKLNSFSLSPVDETELQAQDQQLKKLEEELNILFSTTIQFKKKLTKNKAGLVNDYDAFLSQLTTYKNAWNIHCYDLQAAYYYNYAAVLVESITEEIVESFAMSIKKLEKAIYLFEKSAYFYEKNAKIQEKNETDIEIAKTKTILKSFKQETISSNVEAASSIRRDIALNTQSTSMPSTSHGISLTKEQTLKTNQVLPLKKRKYVIETNVLPAPKKLAADNKNDLTKCQLDKNVASIPVQIVKPIASSLDTKLFRNENFSELEFAELEFAELEFAELESILKKPCVIYFTTFYLQLMFELAKFIKLDKDNGKDIFLHSLLTKLYLLDTLLYLINLLSFENKKNPFIGLESQVFDMRTDLSTHYSIKKIWNFSHLESFKKTIFNENQLRQLFLIEVKDYIWGIETMSKDSELGRRVLHEISGLIRSFFSTDTVKYLIENTLERTRVYLKNIGQEEQLFFYSHLSRELVKFYLAPENKNWAETNKVPLNNPFFLEGLTDWLVLAKKTALIIQDKNFLEKIDFLKKIIMRKKMESNKITQTTHHFFNLTALAVNEEKILVESASTLFNKQFKYHVEEFHYTYGLDLTRLNNLYNALVLFIKRQVENYKYDANTNHHSYSLN